MIFGLNGYFGFFVRIKRIQLQKQCTTKLLLFEEKMQMFREIIHVFSQETYL